MARHPSRNSRILLVVLMVLFINLPVVHSTWTRWRVDRSGTDVTAEVTGHRVVGTDDPRYWLGFRFPEEVDPNRSQWSAEVDRAAYRQAVAEGEVAARVLAERPSAYRVEGQVRHWTGLVITGIADVVLILIVLLAWRSGAPRRPEPVRLSAIGDLEGCPPGAVLEQLDGSLFLARGEVSGVSDQEVVLDLGDREVVVVLAGHRNPVGYRQPAQVRGRLVE